MQIVYNYYNNFIGVLFDVNYILFFCLFTLDTLNTICVNIVSYHLSSRSIFISYDIHLHVV